MVGLAGGRGGRGGGGGEREEDSQEESGLCNVPVRVGCLFAERRMPIYGFIMPNTDN